MKLPAPRYLVYSALCALALLPLAACSGGDKSADEASGEEENYNPAGLWATENTYANQYFGFKFPLPEDWTIDKSPGREIIDQGMDLVFGEGEDREEIDRTFEQTSQMLFLAYKFPPEQMPAENPNCNALVEDISMHGKGLTATDYLRSARELMAEQAQMEMRFPGEIEQVNLGGVPFAVQECISTIQGMQVYQKQYATLKDGLVFLIVTTALSEEGEAEVAAVIQRIEALPEGWEAPAEKPKGPTAVKGQ
jgi:hypothetical protein